MTYTCSLCDPKDPCIFIITEEPSVLYPHLVNDTFREPIEEAEKWLKE